MLTQFYTISPQCTDPNGLQLYLTANPSNSSSYNVTANDQILDESGAQDVSQLWAAIWQPNTNTVILVSQSWSSDDELYVIDAPANNSQVVLALLQPNLQYANWISNDGELQVYGNAGQSLNVWGSGIPPYTSGTPVFSWTYTPGAQNTVWTFNAYGQPDSVGIAKVRAVA